MANKVKQLKVRLIEAKQELVNKILNSEDEDNSKTILIRTVAINVVYLEPVTDDKSNQPKAIIIFAKEKECR